MNSIANRIIILSIFILSIFSIRLAAQEEKVELVYKTITIPLKVEVLYPESYNKGQELPAIVFYHGGGWRNGSLNAFRRQAQYFNSRGLISVLVEYRVETRHGVNPFECVKDARSAMRYIKSNAKKLGIDADKIIASGGSAGGHLSTSLALLDNINSSSDNLDISPKPFALILFNPVLDTSKKGFGFNKFGANNYSKISPLENIKENTPPTLIMVGTNDKVLPVDRAELYQQKMQKKNSRCDLVLYKDQVHSFFNWGKQADHKYFFETLIEADKFLISLGVLSGKENVKEFFKNIND